MYFVGHKRAGAVQPFMSTPRMAEVLEKAPAGEQDHTHDIPDEIG
jgi:hypothetical protein